MTFNNEITAGNVLVIEAIESQNYVAGSAGWKISADGDAEFNSVTVRGELIAGSGADYVKVTPTPQPHIEFSTSNVDQQAPASIGFDISGGNSFTVAGPDMGRGADYTTYAGSPLQNTTTHGFTDVWEVSDPGLEVRLRMVASSKSATLTANGFFNVVTPSFQTNGVDRGKGIKNYANAVASTALAAVETVGITSGNVTFELNRAYRVTLHYQGAGNTAGDQIGFRVRRTNLAGNSLFDTLKTHDLKVANDIVNGESSAIFTNQTGAALATVLVGTVYRAAGAGNVQWFANAANPTWIQIEDIGAASDYPGAKAL
jgi:hypothetical protein